MLLERSASGTGAIVVLLVNGCRSLLVPPVPDLRRERLTQLLLEMRHEPDRSGHDRQAAADLPGDIQLAGDRADRAGGVDRQRPAQRRARLLADELHELDVAP